jgi:hypothetical protein
MAKTAKQAKNTKVEKVAEVPKPEPAPIPEPIPKEEEESDDEFPQELLDEIKEKQKPKPKSNPKNYLYPKKFYEEFCKDFGEEFGMKADDKDENAKDINVLVFKPKELTKSFSTAIYRCTIVGVTIGKKVIEYDTLKELGYKYLQVPGLTSRDNILYTTPFHYVAFSIQGDMRKMEYNESGEKVPIEPIEYNSYRKVTLVDSQKMNNFVKKRADKNKIEVYDPKPSQKELEILSAKEAE